MNGGLMMRSSRLRTVVYCIVLLGMAFVVYLLSSTHSMLRKIEGINEKCQQTKDSISAQLQVAHEYKNRLEKSLQKEKGDHKHQQEELLKQNNDLQAQIQKEKDEASKKYNKLFKDHQSLQNRQQQLEVEVVQLQNGLKNLEEEKKQISMELTHQIQTLQQQKDDEIAKLQVLLNNLMQEKDALQQSNLKEAWEKKRNADALELCQISHSKLKEKCEAAMVQGNKMPVTVKSKQPERPLAPPYHSFFKQQSDVEDRKDEKTRNVPSQSSKKSAEAVLGNNSHNNASSPALNGPKSVSSPSSQNEVYVAPADIHQDDNLHAQVQPPNNYNNNNPVGIQKTFVSPEDDHPHKPLPLPAQRYNMNDEENHVIPHPVNVDAFQNGGIGAGFGPSPYPIQHLHPQGRKVERSANNQEEAAPGPPLPHLNLADHLKRQMEHFHPGDQEAGKKLEGIKRGPQRVVPNNGFLGHRAHDENEENEAADDGANDDNDDPDADNGLDDQAAGAGHRENGKVFQDADFDDQENEGENANLGNQDGEEGVAVVPK